VNDEEKMAAYIREANAAREREREYQRIKKQAKTFKLPLPRREISQSDSERPTFLAACAVAGVPEPVSEWQFARPARAWAFDYAWPEVRLALEVQGGIFSFGRHTTGEGFGRDMEKWNAAVALGWFVIFCIPGEKNKVALTPKRREISWQIPALMNLDTARMVRRVFDEHAKLRFREATP
jgi:hypothetical protein